MELRRPLSIETLYINEFWSFGRVVNILPKKSFRSSLRSLFYRQYFRIQEKNDYSSDYSLYPDFYLSYL